MPQSRSARRLLFLALPFLLLPASSFAQDAPEKAPAPAVVITVSNTRELLEAIGPDRTIQLKSGDYNLTLIDAGDRKYIEWEKEVDGYQLKLRDLANLTLIGVDKKPARILIKPSYAYVLTFSRCQNIHLENLTFGHSPEPGGCSGGVLRFKDCKVLRLGALDLFGCGTDGLWLDEVEDLVVARSTIHDCTEGAVVAANCNKLRFTDCNVLNNVAYGTFFIFNNSDDVQLDKCLISANAGEHGEDVTPDALFSVGPRSRVTLNECRVEKNTVGTLFAVEPLGVLSMTGGSITANTAADLTPPLDPDLPKPTVTFDKVEFKDNSFPAPR